MFKGIPDLSEFRKNKSLIKKEYRNYLRILSIPNIDQRAKNIFNKYKPRGYEFYPHDNLSRELFFAERNDTVDPLNDGMPLIQWTDMLHYIMKIRDILEIEYKCQSCIVRPTCCDYDFWMNTQLYNKCDGVNIISDRFICFIARKYILVE